MRFAIDVISKLRGSTNRAWFADAGLGSSPNREIFRPQPIRAFLSRMSLHISPVAGPPFFSEPSPDSRTSRGLIKLPDREKWSAMSDKISRQQEESHRTPNLDNHPSGGGMAAHEGVNHKKGWGLIRALMDEATLPLTLCVCIG